MEAFFFSLCVLKSGFIIRWHQSHTWSKACSNKNKSENKMEKLVLMNPTHRLWYFQCWSEDSKVVKVKQKDIYCLTSAAQGQVRGPSFAGTSLKLPLWREGFCCAIPSLMRISKTKSHTFLITFWFDLPIVLHRQAERGLGSKSWINTFRSNS